MCEWSGEWWPGWSARPYSGGEHDWHGVPWTGSAETAAGSSPYQPWERARPNTGWWESGPGHTERRGRAGARPPPQEEELLPRSKRLRRQGFPSEAYNQGIAFRTTYPSDWEDHVRQWLRVRSREKIITQEMTEQIVEAVRTQNRALIQAPAPGRAGLLGTGTPSIMTQVLQKLKAFFRRQYGWCPPEELHPQLRQRLCQFEGWQPRYLDFKRIRRLDVATSEADAALAMYGTPGHEHQGEAPREVAWRAALPCDLERCLVAWRARGVPGKCWQVWNVKRQAHVHEFQPPRKRCRVVTQHRGDEHPDCTRDRATCSVECCGHNLRHFVPEGVDPEKLDRSKYPFQAPLLEAGEAGARGSAELAPPPLTTERRTIEYGDEEIEYLADYDPARTVNQGPFWTRWDFDDFCKCVFEPHRQTRSDWLHGTVKDWVNEDLRRWLDRWSIVQGWPHRPQEVPLIEDILGRYPHWFDTDLKQVKQKFPGRKGVEKVPMFNRKTDNIVELRVAAHRRYFDSRAPMTRVPVRSTVALLNPGAVAFHLNEHVETVDPCEPTESELLHMAYDWVPQVEYPTADNPGRLLPRQCFCYNIFDFLPPGTLVGALGEVWMQLPTHDSWRPFRDGGEEEETREREDRSGPQLPRLRADGSPILTEGNHRPRGIASPEEWPVGSEEHRQEVRTLDEHLRRVTFLQSEPSREEKQEFSLRELRSRHWMFYSNNNPEFYRRRLAGEPVGHFEVPPPPELSVSNTGDPWASFMIYKHSEEEWWPGWQVWTPMPEVEADPNQFYTANRQVRREHPRKRRRYAGYVTTCEYHDLGKPPRQRVGEKLDLDEGDVQRRAWAEETEELLKLAGGDLEASIQGQLSSLPSHPSSSSSSSMGWVGRHLNLLLLRSWWDWPFGCRAEDCTAFREPLQRFGNAAMYRETPEDKDRRVVLRTLDWGQGAQRHFRHILEYPSWCWQAPLRQEPHWPERYIRMLKQYFLPRLDEVQPPPQTPAWHLQEALRHEAVSTNYGLYNADRWGELPAFAGGPTWAEPDERPLTGPPWIRLPLSRTNLREDMDHNFSAQQDCQYNEGHARQPGCRCRIFHASPMPFVMAMICSGVAKGSKEGEGGNRANYGSGLYSYWAYESVKNLNYTEGVDLFKNLHFWRCVFEGRVACHHRCAQSTKGTGQRVYQPDGVEWSALWVQLVHATEMENQTQVFERYDPRLELPVGTAVQSLPFEERPASSPEEWVNLE